MDNLLSLKTDFVFNRLFSKTGNEDILKDFLNSILDIHIEKIEIIPEARLTQTSQKNKYGVLDLKATLNDGIIVDIEMQVNDNKNIEKRTLFYAGKIMAEQLKLGEDYKEIKDIIMINILDYDFIDLPEYHTEAITVAKFHRDYEMVKSLRYHFIELPKFRRMNPDMNNKLEQWLTFIDGMNKEGVEMAIKKNKEIKKANDELRYLSGDAELRRLEELKFKAACDETSRMNYLINTSIEEGLKQGIEKGMKQGIEQGIEQGIKQGIEQGIERGIEQGIEQGIERGTRQSKIDIAKKMLEENLDIGIIIKVTGLTKEQIEGIKQ